MLHVCAHSAESAARDPALGDDAGRSGTRRGAPQQQLALARVLRQRRGALELGARLAGAVQLQEQVRTHGGQQVIRAQRGFNFIISPINS